MRERFHGQLAELGRQLGAMYGTAVAELLMANRAQLTRDEELAAEVSTLDAQLDSARSRCERTAQSLLALQAPVAGDLRMVLAAVYCADRIERMGDLARHIAELVGRAEPPESVSDRLRALGELVAEMAEELWIFVSDVDVGGAMFETLDTADERVDELHRELMNEVTGPEWTAGVPAAITVTLLARFYERYADQVVSVARRLDFAYTGDWPVLRPGG
jgi:phosphate transport system protein